MPEPMNPAPITKMYSISLLLLASSCGHLMSHICKLWFLFSAGVQSRKRITSIMGFPTYPWSGMEYAMSSPAEGYMTVKNDSSNSGLPSYFPIKNPGALSMCSVRVTKLLDLHPKLKLALSYNLKPWRLNKSPHL